MTTDTILKACDELLLSKSKASEGPWHWGHQIENSIRDGGELISGDGCFVGEIEFERDLSFILKAANTAAPIAEALKVAVAALEGCANCLTITKWNSETMTAYDEKFETPETRKARQALAEIAKLLGGGK